MPLIRCRRRCSRRRGRLRACPLWVGEEGGLASPLVGLGLEPRVGELVLLLPPPATVTTPRGCPPPPPPRFRARRNRAVRRNTRYVAGSVRQIWLYRVLLSKRTCRCSLSANSLSFFSCRKASLSAWPSKRAQGGAPAPPEPALFVSPPRLSAPSRSGPPPAIAAVTDYPRPPTPTQTALQRCPTAQPPTASGLPAPAGPPARGGGLPRQRRPTQMAWGAARQAADGRRRRP